MKKICLLLILGFLLTSCQKKKEILLPADEIYLIAFNYEFLNPIDTNNRFNVKGISHINKEFIISVVGKKNYNGDYYYTTNTFPDSTKIKLSEIINRYHNDSIFELEDDYALIYDGPTYLFLIKKDGKKDFVRLSGIPHTLPDDLDFFRKQVSDNHVFSSDEILVKNQDSLKQEINRFEKYAFESLVFKEFPIPLPVNSSIKFTPPTINKHE